MKCPKCGGNAELSNWGSYIDPDYADYHVECEKCGYHSMGSTEPQKAKEMFEKGMGMHYTNEAWIKQCTTKQLAKWLSNHSAFIYECGQKQNIPKVMYEENWEWWLKQPHTK